MFYPKKSPHKGQNIVSLIVLLDCRDNCGDCSLASIILVDLLTSRLPETKPIIILFYIDISLFPTAMPPASYRQ
ncbi:conserved protein of unknown function, might belong to Sulfur carrier protein FdhD [Shewanella benthica]|uniref:Uncharacterized protein n=1 Tax=Shewanella benthica TaxID=43661 RepID=A0A330LWF9_9GAMM|nr:conserved protein of unknown function, might belong to Sulfur carrier protein FdhD [Shewanella benthica]